MQILKEKVIQCATLMYFNLIYFTKPIIHTIDKNLYCRLAFILLFSLSLNNNVTTPHQGRYAIVT